ncbi:MAG: hypothetical protein ACI4DS_06140 [Eubacterium sp.]
MMALLVFKEKLRSFYNSYEVYITPILKFLVVLVTLGVIGNNIGYMAKLKSLPVILIVALLSSFLPGGLVVLIVAVIMLAHLYAISLELMCVVLVLLLIMFLVYFRFTSKDSLVLLLMPVLFFLKIPYIMPIAVGLIATPVSVFSVAFATVLCYVLQYASVNAATITNLTSGTAAEKLNIIIGGMFGNAEMYLAIVTFSAVLLTVYAIKRLSVNNSWAVSIIIGGILNMVLLITGGMVLGIYDTKDVLWIVIFSIISVIIAFIVQFFVFSVDYSRTEHTQFEDDEYYYYVKAVPKIKVTASEVNVKRINAQKVKKSKSKHYSKHNRSRSIDKVNNSATEGFSFDDK